MEGARWLNYKVGVSVPVALKMSARSYILYCEDGIPCQLMKLIREMESTPLNRQEKEQPRYRQGPRNYCELTQT